MAAINKNDAHINTAPDGTSRGDAAIEGYLAPIKWTTNLIS
jgi:hypothetical protein